MDIDNDGKLDILSGSYSRTGSSSMAGLFQVLRGGGGGSFAKAKALRGTDGEPLIIPIQSRKQQTQNICTRPTAADWDGDGDLDLVVGNFAGTFYLFTGKGDGKFGPKPAPITVGGAALKIEGAHSDPFLVDWDGDGDLDLLSGSSKGGVQWSENKGEAGKPPVLSSFVPLLDPAMQVSYGKLLDESDLVGPAGSTRVWADDVNGDGKLDLLVGDSLSLIAPADGLSDKEFAERRAEWQKVADALSKKVSAGDRKERSAAQRELNLHNEKRFEFMKKDRTGFVWLYAQK